MKQFLDFSGLKLYDEYIKALIKDGGQELKNELTNIIALAAAAQEEKDSALIGRIQVIEANIGNMEMLDSSVKNLVDAIRKQDIYIQNFEQVVNEKFSALEDNCPTWKELEE